MEPRNSPGTLLRIKRRRGDEAFNTLYVQQPGEKRARSSDNQENDEKSQLFQFVARVPNDELIDIKKILRNEDSKNGSTPTASLAATSINTKKLKDRLQRKKRDSPSANKFKVVPSKRFKLDANDREVSNEPDDGNDEATRLFQMYDVIYDDNDDDIESKVLPSTEHPQDSSVIFEEDSITCNSVRMIREKLSLEDKTNKSPEFTYDLYYAPDVSMELFSDTLYIHPMQEDIFMYDELEDRGQEEYDDEDDSNDEANWRNDYPDEEWGHDSDEEQRYASDLSDESPYSEYRTREGRMKFDPFYVENEEYDFVAYEEDDG